MNIEKELKSLVDKTYQKFEAGAVPNVDPKTVLGIRIPKLRAFAKTIKQEDRDKFLKSLPHKYHDENMLHSILLNDIKDYEKQVEELERFMPYITNWMVSDTVKPKSFSKKVNKDDLKKQVRKWMKSKETYTARIGMDMIQTFFLDDDFDEKLLVESSKLRGEDYYFKMMQAWLFATALAKQREKTLPLIEKKTLDDWTHNKTIQKAKESFRISEKDKKYLETLKVAIKRK